VTVARKRGANANVFESWATAAKWLDSDRVR
jgi:hypothetical protein